MFRLRTDYALLIWLCKRAEPFCQVARWLKILAEFSNRIKYRPGNKHGNADGLSRRLNEGCQQCLGIKSRDEGPSRSELETLPGSGADYSWEHGRLVTAPGQNAEAVRTLHANPALAGNVSELRKL